MLQHNPLVGSVQAQIWGADLRTLPDMGDTPRQTLAENLARLMAESESLRTIKQLHAASGVSTGSIDRIRRGTHATNVDTLAQLSAAFGLEPWQMLIPGVRSGDKAAPTSDAIDAARALLRYAAEMERAAGTVVTLPPPLSALVKSPTQKRRAGRTTKREAS